MPLQLREPASQPPVPDKHWTLDIVLGSSLSITSTTYSVPMSCQLCLLLELVYFPSSQLLLSSFRSLQKGRHSPPTRSLVSGLASLQPTPSTIMSHSILQDLVPNYILDLVLPLIPTYSMFLAIFKHLSCL